MYWERLDCVAGIPFIYRAAPVRFQQDQRPRGFETSQIRWYRDVEGKGTQSGEKRDRGPTLCRLAKWKIDKVTRRIKSRTKVDLWRFHDGNVRCNSSNGLTGVRLVQQLSGPGKEPGYDITREHQSRQENLINKLSIYFRISSDMNFSTSSKSSSHLKQGSYRFCFTLPHHRLNFLLWRIADSSKDVEIFTKTERRVPP